jgi:WhiB family redox-sensing transcriptional regulator
LSLLTGVNGAEIRQNSRREKRQTQKVLKKVTPISAPTTAIWRKQAACRGIDPEVFYPETDEQAEEAKAVCATCPVRQACLEHALAHREREGVWGGTTERERRRIHRQRRRSA